MAMAKLVLLLVALVAAAGCSSSCAAWELNNIRMPTARAMEEAATRLDEISRDVAAPLIHALRPLVGSAGELGRRGGVPCDSWRLAVEAYNKRDWKTVPASCEDYVGHCMIGGHYRRDSRAVVDEAVAYAEGLKLAGNGREVWVFDIDETSLSNLPYYAEHGFGYAEPEGRKLADPNPIGLAMSNRQAARQPMDRGRSDVSSNLSLSASFDAELTNKSKVEVDAAPRAAKNS
ncbi:acid phosphatase 1-like [Panicum miliaceum]|uniref:Acid phosphatase 1-like n=1 Tax=Panicum miliaceum TaxID=4540 RepID=A0A3L6SXE1_PANMI|nr:acid phosphatase 1-like [Panicum miliaceum]